MLIGSRWISLTAFFIVYTHTVALRTSALMKQVYVLNSFIVTWTIRLMSSVSSQIKEDVCKVTIIVFKVNDTVCMV